MRKQLFKITNSTNSQRKCLLRCKQNLLNVMLMSFFATNSYAQQAVQEVDNKAGNSTQTISANNSAVETSNVGQNEADSNQVEDLNQLVEKDPTAVGEITLVGFRERKAKTLDVVHDEPASISVVPGTTLERELAADYNAITKRLASVSFNQANTRSATLSIRGIGKRGSAEVQDPSVLVSQDGISYGLISLGNFEFYDIESVEASRGPTGTQGGKGGSAGQVSFTTRRPSFTPSTDFSIGFGQWDNMVARVATGGPLIDDLLAWRGALLVSKGQGYYRNQYGFDNNRTFYNKDRAAGRVQLLLTPTEDLNIRLSYDRQPKGNQLENGLTFRHDQPEKYDNGTLTDPNGTTARAKFYGFTNNAGAWTGARSWFADRPSPETGNENYSYYGDYLVEEGTGGRVAFNEFQGQYNSTGGSSLDIDWELDDHIVKSLSGYRFFYFNAHNDEGTPFDISKHGGGGIQFKQYSEDLSISSLKGGPIDYKAGVYLYKSETEIDSRTGWGADAGAWFATNAQYNLLDRNAGVNRGQGLALLKDSLNDLYKDGNTWVTTKSNALFGEIDWHWSEEATLTAGMRVGNEDRSTEDDVPLASNGSGGLLNPDEVRGLNLGGFTSLTNGNLGKQIKNADGTTTLINTNSPAQLSVADKLANKYYGAAITDVPGAAYAALTAAQKAQVGAAKGIRATQLGQVYRNVISYYDDTLYTGNLSQSYKFSDVITGYVTWQHGEKSGTAFNINGVPTGVKPEKTNAVEIGVKTFLLDQTLTFNADIYVSDITNYQQSVRLVDEFATEVAIADLPATATAAEKNAAVVYVTAQGNVPEIRTQGVEFDAVYSGIENLNLRISGAYNDAHYVDFKNVPKPDELAYLAEPYIDRAGETIPGASKWTVNAGAEYKYPLDKLDVRTSLNAAYISTYNIGDTYSTYGDLPSYVITDFSIGLASKDGEYDLSLIVKNIFDENPHEIGWTSYQPFLHRRWVGAVFSSHF